jgi:hypothetical protein
MNKICWSLTAVLLAIVLVGAYKFIILGSVEQGSDGRTSIQLDAAERDTVLAEMRAFLTSVQQITDGITRKDMHLVSTSARGVGRAAQTGVPASLMGKLPLEFKQLGFDTHTKFDQLALDAEQLGDETVSLSQLATLLHNCVACHTAYRIEVPGDR